jgi:GT2 family glycosyltransferase
MFCILIPTVNQAQMLYKALDWYTKYLPNTDIVVLDNGNQGIEYEAPNFQLVQAPYNLGVAKSWNHLIDLCSKKHQYFLVLQDDVILMRTEAEISEMIRSFNDFTFFRPETAYGWAAFVINRWMHQRIGLFDEKFVKLGLEDKDYEYRMRLNGVNIRYSPEINPQFFRNSQSIIKNPSLDGYDENRKYYAEKWGGLPGQEKSKTPFTP